MRKTFFRYAAPAPAEAFRNAFVSGFANAGSGLHFEASHP